MNDDTNPRIETLETDEVPKAAQLIAELEECILAGNAMGIFSRLVNCHNTRRCLWNHKQPDGRLAEMESQPGQQEKQVWRWPGAPDVSVYTCDKIVRWLMLLRSAVTSRGDVRCEPRRAADDAPAQLASLWQTTMDALLEEKSFNLAYQTDLFSACAEELGYGMILVDDERKQRSELLTMDLQSITDMLVEQGRQAKLIELAQQAQEAQSEEPLELTEEEDSAIVQNVNVKLEMLLADEDGDDEPYVALLQSVDPKMSEDEAESVLEQLRDEPTQPAKYTAPRDDGVMFNVETLMPWINCVHPVTMSGEGKTDALFVVRYYSETKLREKAEAEKWDKEAMEELLTKKNQFFEQLTTQSAITIPNWSLNSMGVGLVIDRTALEKLPRWLVVYVWRKAVNEKGLPMVYKGAFHPNMPDHMLFWEPTDLEEMPLVVDTAEPVMYAIQSRGVADIVADKQSFVKDTLDGEGARGQLGSNPPLLRTAGEHVGITPGKELYAKRSGTSSYAGSQFMEVPKIDQGSMAVMAYVDKLVDDYYFRGKDTDPEDKAMFREWKVLQARRCQVAVLRIIWTIMQEKMSDAQISDINGQMIKLGMKRDQLKGRAAISIGVHVDGYGEDASKKFAEVLSIMMQNDRAGAVDWNEAMMILARMLTPTYANRLVMNQQAASGKIVDDQQSRIAKIMAGVPVGYDDKASNPQLRMQVLQQWMQMPGNVQRAQMDPTLAGMMQKEQEYLSFQQQQIQNAATGRTGVKPN